MQKMLIPTIVLSLFFISQVNAQDSTKISMLEQRLKVLEKKIEQNELEKIMKEAESLAREQKAEKKTKVFKGGQRSHQALNPEISLASDAYGQYIINKDGFNETSRSGAHFRVAELQIQSMLDPFSKTKVILEFKPEGVEFAEGYLTWNRVLPNVSLTAGKFRQQFGVVNRWHAHALDQYEFPLALTTILGGEGLNQMGLSFDWFMPSFLKSANNLTLQITNGQNKHLFSGEVFSFPATLLHYKNFRDLSRNSYLEFGFTGMLGRNDVRGYVEGERVYQSTRWTKLAGFDLSFLWEPVDQAKYKSLQWRSEFYYADKELPGSEHIYAWGGYTYTEYKFGERWQGGVRFDYTQPFQVNNDGLHLYQVVPYLTWWQSHWVKLRLQYNYLDGNTISKPDHVLRLQITWAAGPHKHERY